MRRTVHKRTYSQTSPLGYFGYFFSEQKIVEIRNTHIRVLLLVTLQIQYLHLEFFGNAFCVNIKRSGKECKLWFKIIELFKTSVELCKKFRNDICIIF